MEYFIDHWLETRVGEKAITNGNRNKVVTALEGYEGKTPYKRDALNAYLDKHFNKSAPKPSKP